eukprot:scaffold220589_cov19-Tisochrysis_lutea.AAC.3
MGGERASRSYLGHAAVRTGSQLWLLSSVCIVAESVLPYLLQRCKSFKLGTGEPKCLFGCAWQTFTLCLPSGVFSILASVAGILIGKSRLREPSCALVCYDGLDRSQQSEGSHHQLSFSQTGPGLSGQELTRQLFMEVPPCACGGVGEREHSILRLGTRPAVCVYLGQSSSKIQGCTPCASGGEGKKEHCMLECGNGLTGFSNETRACRGRKGIICVLHHQMAGGRESVLPSQA